MERAGKEASIYNMCRAKSGGPQAVGDSTYRQIEWIHTTLQLKPNNATSGEKGSVIICRVRKLAICPEPLSHVTWSKILYPSGIWQKWYAGSGWMGPWVRKGVLFLNSAEGEFCLAAPYILVKMPGLVRKVLRTRIYFMSLVDLKSLAQTIE